MDFNSYNTDLFVTCACFPFTTHIHTHTFNKYSIPQSDPEKKNCSRHFGTTAALIIH